METTTCSHLLGLVVISFILVPPKAFAADGVADTFSKGRNITDNETLVSANGAFTMGFFSPGVSTKRYLGIWFTVSRDAVCWVANRESPIHDNSGVLMVSDTGSLLLLDGSGRIAWSSNSSSTSPVEAQLLDNGNLVVRNPGSTTVLWHSFAHPSNVMLSGMKVGKDFSSGDEWYLTSWRSADDPSPGAFRRVLDTSGRPDNIVWQGSVKTFRSGPWNGVRFGGIPEVLTYQQDLFEYQMVISPREVTYGYNVKPGAAFTYVVLTDDGEVKRLVWDASIRAWQTTYQGPRDVCDAYGKCGAFNLCNVSAASAAFCGCIRGFGLVSPSRIAGRCQRNVALNCAAGGATTDGFVPVSGVKLPDTHNASVDTGITVEECRARCLANCSCLAYAAADISAGGDGRGCIMWADDLLDMRYVDKGQDLYLRLAESELPPPPAALPPPSLPSRSRAFPTGPVIGAVGSLVGILLVAFLVLVVIRRRRRRRPSNIGPTTPDGFIQRTTPAPTVPSSELSSLKKATGDFSESNIIGRGGFGIVYEGHLPDGRKVAVKRLVQSSLTDEGGNAFMREVGVMSKLRHGNLLQLLSYCQDGNERILVYKYMKNKSLNLYIFGVNLRLRALLNWDRRLEIVRGVARGVAYLHGLSEEVIHRDLKSSNILLDDNWRPKIADFGTAKLFVVDETDPTLIKSAGYTAPEYLSSERHLTLKCDVYSFGIILMEIISGKRNIDTPALLSDVSTAFISDKKNSAIPSTSHMFMKWA